MSLIAPRCFHRTLLAPSLVAALSACTAAQEESPDKKLREPAPAEVQDPTGPMASFARLVPGEWWVTLNDGTSGFNTWRWGPGKHSIRVADGVEVYYWHPGRKEVCTLSLSSYASGVSEGTVQFEGETAEIVFDHYQTTGRRKLVLRWAFDGRDRYHEALFEALGSTEVGPMSEWNHVRKLPTAPSPPAAEETPQPLEHLQALASLLGHTWEAEGDWAGQAFRVQTVFEQVPYVEGIYASTMALSEDGAPVHLFDAYFYHHTGTGALRCLALSSRGGVYEGDLTVLEDGALQLDLQGYEGDQVVPHVVRFDFEQDGTLRQRAWSLAGTDRKLLLDVRHEQVKPQTG